MNRFLQKTFGGITRTFYWRQFLFGLLFYIPLMYQYLKLLKVEDMYVSGFIMLILSVMQFLFPYARFVYHSITDFLLGGNVLIVNVFIMLIYKLIVGAICWVFSPIIAFFGLVYLYFYHSRKE